VGVLTGTPGLSGGLVTSLLAHSVWLALVLGHTSVDGLDDIGTDRSLPSIPSVYRSRGCGKIFSKLQGPEFATYREDLWERVGRTAGSAIGGQDRDGRTGSHLE
jgi:hypothetical protein